MLNETIEEPVKSKARGFGRGYGRRKREDAAPTPIGENKPKAIGRGRPKSNIANEDIFKPEIVKEKYENSPDKSSTESDTSNSRDSALNNEHTRPLPTYSRPLPVYNTPTNITSRSSPRFNNQYSTSPTRYNNTPPHSPTTSRDNLRDNSNSPKNTKDTFQNTRYNSPTRTNNDMSPKSFNCPPDPINILDREASPNRSRFDSKNRALGRAKFSSPAFRPMTAKEATPSPRGNTLPNGVEPGLNLTYIEPLEKGTHTKPDDMAITWLKSGQHLLDPNLTGEVHYHKQYYDKNKADKIFHMLMGSLNFVSPSKVTKDGEIVVQPRISLWFAPPDHPYSYSYVTLQPHDFNSNYVMKSIKNDMESLFGTTFNSCLVNLYRDNNDGCGWHADDEETLGLDPVIASVSLGETRRFHFCKKSDVDRRPVYGFHLEHGSALLMKGDVQSNWLHKIPKERHDRKPRLNLTFRTIIKKQKMRA